MSWAAKTERIRNNQTAVLLQLVQTIFWTISTWLKTELPSRPQVPVGNHPQLIRKCISFYTRHRDWMDPLSLVLALNIKTPLAASGESQELPEKRAHVSDMCSRMNYMGKIIFFLISNTGSWTKFTSSKWDSGLACSSRQCHLCNHHLFLSPVFLMCSEYVCHQHPSCSNCGSHCPGSSGGGCGNINSVVLIRVSFGLPWQVSHNLLICNWISPNYTCISLLHLSHSYRYSELI